MQISTSTQTDGPSAVISRSSQTEPSSTLLQSDDDHDVSFTLVKTRLFWQFVFVADVVIVNCNK